MSSGAEPHALRGSGRVLAGTLAARAVQFGAQFVFYALAARALAVRDFGTFMLGIAAVQLAAALARRGLDQALLAADDPRALRGYALRKVLHAAAALALAAALVLAGTGTADAASLAFCVALPAVALAQVAFGALRAEGEIARGNVAEALQPAAAVAFGLVAWMQPGALAFVLAWTGSWAASLALSWWHLRRSRDPAAASPEAQRALLAAGGAMAGVYLLGQIGTTADGVLLGVFASVTEVARYAPAQKIAGAFALLHTAFTVAAGPMARRYLDRPALLQRYLRMLSRLGTALALPVAVATLGVPGWLPSLFGATYGAQSGGVLQWLALAAMAPLVTGPLGNALLAAGHAGTLLRTTAVGTGVLVLLLVAFAAGGAEHAAVCVVVSMLTSRALMVAAAWRKLGVQPFGPALLPLLAGGAAGVGLARLLAPGWHVLAANAAGMALALAVAALVLARTHDLRFLRAELLRRPAP